MIAADGLRCSVVTQPVNIGHWQPAHQGREDKRIQRVAGQLEAMKRLARDPAVRARWDAFECLDRLIRVA